MEFLESRPSDAWNALEKTFLHFFLNFILFKTLLYNTTLRSLLLLLMYVYDTRYSCTNSKLFSFQLYLIQNYAETGIIAI